MPNITTGPLIILILLLWHWTGGRIISVILFLAMFDAASALNVGAVGVLPWLFGLVICLGLKLIKGHRPLKVNADANRWAVGLMLLFVVYTSFSSMAFPFLFHGVPVVHNSDPMPLQWGMSNLAQFFYLCASSFIFLIVLCSPAADLRHAMNWYVKGCVVASLIAFYQLANAMFHIPYPDTLFYSNTAHAIYHAYKINGMWRLNGPFPEASAMATYLSVGVALLGWEMVTKPARLGRSVAFLLILTALLFTQSSTGYASLALILFVGIFLYLKYLLGQGGMEPVKLVGAASMLVLVIGLLAFTGTGPLVVKVINTTLLGKKGTASYEERKYTNDSAVATAEATYYIGAGWGSVRASGLWFNLLGTVGIAGVVIFALFTISLYAPLLRGNARGMPRRDDRLYERSLFALMIMLGGLLLAGAEPVEPMLWVLFGVATVSKPLRKLGEVTPSTHMFPSSDTRQYV